MSKTSGLSSGPKFANRRHTGRYVQRTLLLAADRAQMVQKFSLSSLQYEHVVDGDSRVLPEDGWIRARELVGRTVTLNDGASYISVSASSRADNISITRSTDREYSLTVSLLTRVVVWLGVAIPVPVALLGQCIYLTSPQPDKGERGRTIRSSVTKCNRMIRHPGPSPDLLAEGFFIRGLPVERRVGLFHVVCGRRCCQTLAAS